MSKPWSILAGSIFCTGGLLTGLNRHGIVGIDYTDTGSRTPAHVPRCDLSARNELVAITGCLVIASAPLFVAMSHQYLTEPLQLLAVGWFVLIMSFAPKWPQLRS